MKKQLKEISELKESAGEVVNVAALQAWRVQQ